MNVQQNYKNTSVLMNFYWHVKCLSLTGMVGKNTGS
jgi:hypothetical protein